MIRLCVPYTGPEELAAIAEVLSSGYLTQGQKVAEFEKAVAEYVGTKYAFATSSCTTALHLSLAAIGIGPGDEVLVPDFTFPATANVVVQQHAVPILVDIDLATFTLNIQDLESKITDKTRAVIPVQAFGLAADMDPICQLSKKHGLAVIEDAACALGAQYKGVQCGAIGDLACFSFHPRKSITTGEGGMITTDSDVLAAKISLLRSHGGVRRDGRFFFEDAGYNYRLSEIHGAMGIEQMKKCDRILSLKHKLATSLSEKLSAIEKLKTPSQPNYARHTYQSFVVLLNEDIDRDKVIKYMYAQGIETTIGTYALHLQPYFARTHNYLPGAMVNSKAAFDRSLTLPLYADLSDEEMSFIVETLKNILADKRVLRHQ
jgi:dTDP-4-amino-4,6-dideoxygalactose transaminase